MPSVAHVLVYLLIGHINDGSARHLHASGAVACGSFLLREEQVHFASKLALPCKTYHRLVGVFHVEFTVHGVVVARGCETLLQLNG